MESFTLDVSATEQNTLLFVTGHAARLGKFNFSQVLRCLAQVSWAKWWSDFLVFQLLPVYAYEPWVPFQFLNTSIS